MNKVFIFAIFISIFFHSVIFASIRSVSNNSIAENISIVEISVAKKGSNTNQDILPQNKVEEKQNKSRKEIKKDKKEENKIYKKEVAIKDKDIPVKKVVENNKIESNSNNNDTLVAKAGNDLHGKDNGKVAPVAHKIPKPKYPRKSRQNGEEGVVMIELIVNEVGKGENAKVITSSGFKALDDEALAVIPKSEFIPAKINGVAVASVMRLKIRFTIDD